MYFGGEGWFQTKISGTGLWMLAIPTPLAEVLKYELKNKSCRLMVTLYSSGQLPFNFTVEKSAKGLVGPDERGWSSSDL